MLKREWKQRFHETLKRWAGMRRYGYRSRFLTLTVDVEKEQAEGRDREGAFRDLLGRWDRLRKRWVRAGWLEEYICVVEATEEEWPHLHLLVVGRLFRSQEELSRDAQECGFGGVLWVEEVFNRSVVDYCLKAVAYIVKGAASMPRGLRRVRHSQANCRPLPKSSMFGPEWSWGLRRYHHEAYTIMLEVEQGAEVMDCGGITLLIVGERDRDVGSAGT